jgi:hypothetical protein
MGLELILILFFLQAIGDIKMIKISGNNESRLINLAIMTGKSVDEFIEILLENYQDELDVKEAEQVLQESGGISLSELKNKYGL